MAAQQAQINSPENQLFWVFYASNRPQVKSLYTRQREHPHVKRSDTYEKKYRNLVQKVSRAAERKADMEEQLDDLSAELIRRKTKEEELRAKNTELTHRKEALSRS
ncbi:hypothetical protein K438DRAFT_1777107, partial [Mycena galopus ATCC 62051]